MAETMENTDAQIKSLKSMMDSCFAYGGVEKDTWNYKRYILPHKKELGKLFTKTYNEHMKYLKKCTVKVNVYTDGEGLNYNSIIPPDCA